MKEDVEGLTRREFTKGAAAAMLAAMLGPNWLKILEKARAQSMTIPEAWDAEHDVIVVGCGCAGAAAAIGASEAGADTVVLEAAPVPGGTSAMSGGMFNLGGGTALQRDLGVDETREEFYRYLVAQAECERVVPALFGLRELQRVHADHAVETYDWLENTLELPFPRLLATPRNIGFAGLFFLGNEYYPPILRKVGKAVPHAHAQLTMGAGLMETMIAYAKDKNASIMVNTRANHLIAEPTTGEIIGVRAIRRGREINIKARRGVVLAAGGHGHNKELVKDMPLNSIEDASFRPAANRGDGHLMALEVGADFFACDGGQFLIPYGIGIPLFALAVLPPWWNIFYIDRNGKRFCNEQWHIGCIENYFYRTGKWNDKTKRWDRLPAGWLLFDNASRLGLMGLPGMPVEMALLGALTGKIESEFEVPGYGKRFRCKAVSGRTIESLCAATKETDAEGIGIDPKGLRETINQWNKLLPDDPVWGRDYGLVKFGAPPYYAAPVWPTSFNEATGITINANGQALDTTGKPIPKLYCAGRNSGGQYGQMYTCGTAVGTGIIIGKIAGRNAAKESRWVE